MLDHVILSVSDLDRSVVFYGASLAPLGITDRVDYAGKDGPPVHPDLKGFGRTGRFFLWLRMGVVEGRAARVGFVANSAAQVDATYAAAMAAGRPTMARRARGFTMIRAIMPGTCSTPTAIASSSSTRAGSTPGPECEAADPTRLTAVVGRQSSMSTFHPSRTLGVAPKTRFSRCRW